MAFPEPPTISIKFTRSDGLVAQVLADPGKTVLLGRDLSCDVRLDGRKVSRRHLRIENRGGGGVHLVDNGSHNGTFVNGQRVSEVPLAAGDIVQAGEWEGRVELLGAGTASPSPATSGPHRAPMMMPAIQLASVPSSAASSGS